MKLMCLWTDGTERGTGFQWFERKPCRASSQGVKKARDAKGQHGRESSPRNKNEEKKKQQPSEVLADLMNHDMGREEPAESADANAADSEPAPDAQAAVPAEEKPWSVHDFGWR